MRTSEKIKEEIKKESDDRMRNGKQKHENLIEGGYKKLSNAKTYQSLHVYAKFDSKLLFLRSLDNKNILLNEREQKALAKLMRAETK